MSQKIYVISRPDIEQCVYEVAARYPRPVAKEWGYHKPDAIRGILCGLEERSGDDIDVARVCAKIYDLFTPKLPARANIALVALIKAVTAKRRPYIP